jgi:arylsulfatase A-like enzyme
VASPEKVDAMIALYDAEVAYADEQLGRVQEAARAAAPDGNLLIVVTADHGESMGEHGLYWFRYLYDPTLLVPLVIVPPGSMSMPSDVVDTQVRLIDLVPTVLDMLDVDAGTTFDGSSLLALMRAGDGVSPGPAFSSRYSSSTEFSRERHAIRDRGWKLIHTKPGWDGGGGATPLEGDSRELYELAADPGELTNLLDTGAAIQQQLGQQLDEVVGQGVTLDLELTDEERERLRSLGYVQ